jgi:acyl carrier protein
MPNPKLHSVLAGLETGRVRSAARTSDDLFSGRDSIAKLEALLAIEAAFNISLSEEELAGVRTLADLESLVDAKCAAAPADEPKSVSHRSPSVKPLRSRPCPSRPGAGPFPPCSFSGYAAGFVCK